MVERHGEDKVIQVVTDSASSAVKSRDLLVAKYPHITSSACTAHCLDLALEDIGKLPMV